MSSKETQKRWFGLCDNITHGYGLVQIQKDKINGNPKKT